MNPMVLTKWDDPSSGWLKGTVLGIHTLPETNIAHENHHLPW